MSDVLREALAGPSALDGVGGGDALLGRTLSCPTVCFFHRRFWGILSQKVDPSPLRSVFLAAPVPSSMGWAPACSCISSGRGSEGPADSLLPPLFYSPLIALFSPLFLFCFLSFSVFFTFQNIFPLFPLPAPFPSPFLSFFPALLPSFSSFLPFSPSSALSSPSFLFSPSFPPNF